MLKYFLLFIPFTIKAAVITYGGITFKEEGGRNCLAIIEESPYGQEEVIYSSLQIETLLKNLPGVKTHIKKSLKIKEKSLLRIIGKKKPFGSFK